MITGCKSICILHGKTDDKQMTIHENQIKQLKQYFLKARKTHHMKIENREYKQSVNERNEENIP